MREPASRIYSHQAPYCRRTVEALATVEQLHALRVSRLGLLSWLVTSSCANSRRCSYFSPSAAVALICAHSSQCFYCPTIRKGWGEATGIQVARTRPPPLHSPPPSLPPQSIVQPLVPFLASRQGCTKSAYHYRRLRSRHPPPNVAAPPSRAYSLRAPECLKQPLFLLEQIALPLRHRLKLLLACVEHLHPPHTHHSIDTTFTHTLARTLYANTMRLHLSTPSGSLCKGARQPRSTLHLKP